MNDIPRNWRESRQREFNVLHHIYTQVGKDVLTPELQDRHVNIFTELRFLGVPKMERDLKTKITTSSVRALDDMHSPPSPERI